MEILKRIYSEGSLSLFTSKQHSLWVQPMCAATFGISQSHHESEQESGDRPVKTLTHRSTNTALRTVSGGQKTGSSYLMDVYGRLRVREYNTLHRAIRKSSWGPVRCNIALHLRIQTVTGYSPSNPKTKTILSSRTLHLPLHITQ